jgi:hypothetical protein
MSSTNSVRGISEPVGELWEKCSGPEISPKIRRAFDVHDSPFIVGQLSTIEKILKMKKASSTKDPSLDKT